MKWYKEEHGPELLAYDPASETVFHVGEPEAEGEPHQGRFLKGGDPDETYEAESVGELREIAEDEIEYRRENPPTYDEPSGGGGGWVVGLGLLGLLGLGLYEWSQRQGRDVKAAGDWLQRQRAQQPQLPPPSSQPFGPGR